MAATAFRLPRIIPAGNDIEMRAASVELADAAQLAVERNAPDLKKTFNWASSHNAAESRRRIEANMARGIGAHYDILYEGKFAGGISAPARIADGTPIEYWIDRDKRRNGIAKAATRQFLSVLFEEWDINSGIFQIAATNFPSKKVAESLSAKRIDGGLSCACLRFLPSAIGEWLPSEIWRVDRA